MKPKIWVDGKRVRVVPQCADCGLVLDDGLPLTHSWEYVQLDPHKDTWGWLCPKCQDK